MILLDGIIYVGQRFRRTISAYPLCPNPFSSDPFLCPQGGVFRQQKCKSNGNQSSIPTASPSSSIARRI